MRKAIVFCTVLLCSFNGFAAEDGLVAWWNFDSIKDTKTEEAISGAKDEIRGNFKYVNGSAGKGLRFDGFTTSLVRQSPESPKLNDAFTIEAWIALGAYPWNWCPIVSRSEEEKAGYYLGIDSQGHVGFRLAIDGKWYECKSQNIPELKVGLELRKWYHIAGVYDSKKGITVYIDGKKAAALTVTGKVNFAEDVDLLIGRNHKKMVPTHPVRDWATYPSWYSFDGIIDEIKIFNRSLSVEEITTAFESGKPQQKPDIPQRRFPTVPSSGLFGAFYTKLKYYEEWDALWPMGDYSDIVVQFDEYPIKVMFWRGTRYSPCWVTENGKWMADQSRETSENWGKRWDGPTGCCEHMSDAQCRNSHVRLIESSDARVVIHWRYAQQDVLYRQSHVDPDTGWGDWADEYYTIYPDGVGVRYVASGRGGWQETIFLNEPGTVPEDNCELEAITIVNSDGQSQTVSWENGYPKFNLDEPIIQMTNLKSKYRPFMIFRPKSKMRVFNVEVRPEYSHFPWWNHWPVAQVASDGRHAQAPDRATHSSLVWGDPKGNAALYGMTKEPAVSLVSLAKSWISPAELKVSGDKFASEGYDYKRRAYVVDCKEPRNGLDFQLTGSAETPIVNPCFVIKNWGQNDAVLKVNGKIIKRGKDFRYGHRHRIQGSDLVVWMKMTEMKPVNVEISSGK